MVSNITLYDIGMDAVEKIIEPSRKSNGDISHLRGKCTSDILLQMISSYAVKKEYNHLVGAAYMLDGSVVVVRAYMFKIEKYVYRVNTDKQRYEVVKNLHKRMPIDAFVGIQELSAPEDYSDEYIYFRFIHLDSSDCIKEQKIISLETMRNKM